MEKYIEFTDISRWQGDVNFKAMRAQGVKLVYIRAAIGNNYKDPRFEEYWDGAGEAGLLRGAYIATVPGQSGQVAFFRLVLDGRKADFPHMIDNEIYERRILKIKGGTDKKKSVWIWVPYTRKTINDTFMQVYGEFVAWSGHPITYMNASMGYRMGDTAFLRNLKGGRWVAYYTKGDKPLLPTSWDGWEAWQHSADNNNVGPKYGGSADSMDLNRMKPEFFTRFSGKEDPPPPTEPLTLQSLDKRVVELEDWRKTF